MDTNVKNANYGRVMAVLEKLLKERSSDRNWCGCRRCINEIAAIALNYLPPHYYVEEHYTAELGSPWIMVETAVVEAIERVTEGPHHSDQKYIENR
jgi:competence protein ComFB